MKYLTPILLLIITITLVGSYVILKDINANKAEVLGFADVNSFWTGQVATTSKTIEAGVGALLVPERASRKYAIVTNTSATIAYLAFDDATTTAYLPRVASTSYAIPVAASGGTYEIDYDNLYLGPIQATSSGKVTLRVLEAY